MKRQKERELPPVVEAVKFELRSQFQRDVIKSIRRNHITALIGNAGSGKTLLACYAALQLHSSGDIKKIAVVRLAREAHFEKIGALPGSVEDKLGFISAPIYDNLELMLPRTKIDNMVANKTIEILPVSYLRGRSLHDTLLIVEEVQNLPREAVLTILTRIAAGSKIVLTGDPDQQDFEHVNSCNWVAQLLHGVSGCTLYNMPAVENYRHPVIPAILANAKRHLTPTLAPTLLTTSNSPTPTLRTPDYPDVS